MFSRLLLLIILLGAAFGIPYMSSHWSTMVDGVTGTLRSIIPGEPTQPSAVPATSLAPMGPGPIPAPGFGEFRPMTVPSLEGLPVYNLAEVLRMDVTTAWVYNRWSRKSTALSEPDLYGIRVPLVTGTQVDDLAGSLTYYFNGEGRVQRLSFSGRTGDTRKLVRLVTSMYGLRLQSSDVPGEQVYQTKWNGKPISELRIRPAHVIWASAPHASFEVRLELERPGSGRYLVRSKSQLRHRAPANRPSDPVVAPESGGPPRRGRSLKPPPVRTRAANTTAPVSSRPPIGV